MGYVSKILEKSLQQLRDRLPASTVEVVPAHAFFVRIVEIPADLSASDKIDFVELFLESKAPFPIEHLCWGFVEARDSPHAWVYATTKGRMRQLGYDHFEQYFHLFPVFLVRFGSVYEQPTLSFLYHRNALSVLYYAAGNPIPERVVSVPLSADGPADPAILSARSHWVGHAAGSEYLPESGVWCIHRMELGPRDEPRFVMSRIGIDGSAAEDAGLQEFIPDLDKDRIWMADLRDPAYAKVEKHRRRRSLLLWRSLRMSLLAAVALLLLQAGNLGLRTAVHLQERKIEALGASAIRVENKFTLANRLTESTEKDIRPFALLEAINPIRPNTVYFTKIRTRSFNTLEIEGDSEQGVTPVNAYSDSLQQLAFVASVDSSVQTRSNQTSFSFKVHFAELPPGADRPLVIPDEEAAADETAALSR